MKTQDAIDHFKDARKLARILGISTAAIYAWGEDVPDMRQYQLHYLSKGKLKPRDGLQAKNGWVEHEG